MDFKHSINSGIYLFWMILLLISTSAASAQGILVDPRDNQEYPLIEIGDMTWFARNLNYDSEHSYCYNGEATNCEEYGRLYRWEVSLSACPKGWHNASEYEWQALEFALGMEFRELQYRSNRGTDEGTQLKVDGSSGFHGQFGGWRNNRGSFDALGENGAWWTSTEADLDHAWHRDLDEDAFVYRSRVYKPYALSVRCVKDRLVDDLPPE